MRLDICTSWHGMRRKEVFAWIGATVC